MRVSLLAIAIVLGAGVSSASAQNVDDLVARHVEARGGYEKLKALQTVRITRTVATPFSNVRVVIYKKRPQLYRTEQGPAGQPPIVRVINAEAAWDTAADGKTVMRAPQTAAEAREMDGDFDGLLVDWKQKGHRLALEGRETLTAGETFKLKLTTRTGLMRYVYLDATTYLERRQTGARTLPNNTTETFVMDFSNWRTIDGVTFPFNIDEDRTGPQVTQSFAIYTEKIELNVPLEDALFATPARIP
jgi:hypothetical protein